MRNGGWEGLATRVRGLSTHLVGAARMRELLRIGDLRMLVRALEELHVVESVAGSPVGVETAMRRVAAQRLATMWRWADTRQAQLAPLLEEEDRRSVRALVRGAAAGASPAARLAGLLATPTLPAAALDELASQATPAEVGTLLRAWGHPFGDVVIPSAASDLFATECALQRKWATRAAAAVRFGPGTMQAFIGLLVDLANAATALTLAGSHADVEAAALFTPGGAHVGAAAFARAATARSPAAAGEQLAAAMEPPLLAAAVSDASMGHVPLEDGALRALIGWSRDLSRREPTGPAPVIHYVLRLRAQLRDIQLLVWRLALSAPQPSPHQLVSAVA
ncbi:MAG: V-type ATPase subunit [Gemmatimonadaceae bacterium]